MSTRHIIRGSVLVAAACGALASQAAVIDFESLSGPSTYAAAGARRDLDLGGVLISGGTVLSAETFLPANSSTLYGTAFFGSSIPASNPYLGTITIDLRQLNTPINSFYLDIYNGQVFNVTYTLADNAGHSASFVLAPNLASGTTQIGFTPSGDVITLTSDAGNLWDFSIDNLHYNEGVPTTVPTTVQPPPTPTTIDPPPVTLVSIDTPPPVQLETPDQRLIEGLDNQNQRRRQKGKNGEKLDFRTEAQGFDDRLVPAPVPLPSPLPLLGVALGGLVMRRRVR